MSRLLVAQRALTVPAWVKDFLWRRARAVPSLDLRFADNKSLADAVTGQQLVTFTRASSGTFTDSAGTLQTAATNEPRFDHNPTTGESLGLLVEEARTNLVLRSEEFDNAAWTKVGGTISANSTGSPSGAITADTLVEDTSTGTHRCLISATIANTTIYTVSAYAKAAGRTHVRLALGSGLAGELTANLSSGTVAASSGATNPTVQSVGNGWYRISFTSAASSSTSGQVQLQLIQGTSTTSYTGDGASGAYFWGAQLEAGAFASSYIATAGATATRSADVVSISNANLLPWFTSFDEHTFYAELRGDAPKGLGSIIMEGLVSGAIGGITLGLNSTSTRFRTQQRHGVARFDSGNTLGGLLTSTINRVAVRASALGSQSAENGLLPSAGTIAQSDWNTGASIAIGKRSTSSSLFLNGCIARIIYWPQSFADPTLQSLTQ